MDLSFGGLLAALIFSCVGFVAFMYGKRQGQFRTMGLGAALMIYPYFVRGVAANWLVGAALTALLLFWRE